MTPLRVLPRTRHRQRALLAGWGLGPSVLVAVYLTLLVAHSRASNEASNDALKSTLRTRDQLQALGMAEAYNPVLPVVAAVTRPLKVRETQLEESKAASSTQVSSTLSAKDGSDIPSLATYTLNRWNPMYFQSGSSNTPQDELVQGMIIRQVSCPARPIGTLKFKDCLAKVGMNSGCDDPRKALLVCCRVRESDDCQGAGSGNHWLRLGQENNGRMGFRAEVYAGAWGIQKWGAVCRDGIMDNTVESICRELGLPTQMVTHGSYGMSDAPPGRCVLSCKHGGHAVTKGHKCQCQCNGWKWDGRLCDHERVLSCSELMNYYIDPEFVNIAKKASVTKTQLEGAWYFNIVDFPGVREITEGDFGTNSELHRRQPNLDSCLQYYRQRIRTSVSVQTPQYVSDTMGLPMEDLWGNMATHDSKLRMLLDWMIYVGNFKISNNENIAVERFRRWLNIRKKDCPWEESNQAMAKDKKEVDKDLERERRNIVGFQAKLLHLDLKRRQHSKLIAGVAGKVMKNAASTEELKALERNLHQLMEIMADGCVELYNKAMNTHAELADLMKTIPKKISQVDELRTKNTEAAMTENIVRVKELQNDLRSAIQLVRHKRHKLIHSATTPLVVAVHTLELFQSSIRHLMEEFHEQGMLLKDLVTQELTKMRIETGQNLSKEMESVKERAEVKSKLGLKRTEVVLGRVSARAESSQNAMIRKLTHRVNFVEHMHKGFSKSLQRHSEYVNAVRVKVQQRIEHMKRKAFNQVSLDRNDLNSDRVRLQAFSEEMDGLVEKFRESVSSRMAAEEKSASISSNLVDKKLNSQMASKTRFLKFLLEQGQDTISKIRLEREHLEDMVQKLQDKQRAMIQNFNEEKSLVTTVRDKVERKNMITQLRFKWWEEKRLTDDQAVGDREEECVKWAKGEAEHIARASSTMELSQADIEHMPNFKRVIAQVCRKSNNESKK